MKSLSCSFADCRDPGYARWLRVAYILNVDEPVNTTFLACREHDARLNDPDDTSIPSGVLRIGLVEDEVCWCEPGGVAGDRAEPSMEWRFDG